jgi:L-alanine-DL-glutamate epimerase-like enolase superfamily enzyme
MQTAQATLDLLSSLKEADKDDVIQVLTTATLATSAPAMREVVLRATEQATALDNASWEPFKRLSHMSAERVPHAQGLVETVKELLTRDEHVLSLARGLKEAQAAAFKMLTDAVEPPPENSQRGIGLKDATAVFDTITRALRADPELVLDINWRLHPKDESAP